jgi:hypothetical protein
MSSSRPRWSGEILRSGHLTVVLMDAAGSVCPAAVAERDPPAFEVAEERVSLLVGRGPVFFAGPEFAPAGDERPVTADGLLGMSAYEVACRAGYEQSCRGSGVSACNAVLQLEACAVIGDLHGAGAGDGAGRGAVA